MDELIFDSILPIQEPVTLAGKKHILREATGDAVIRWRDAQLRATRLVDGKPAGIDGLAASEPILISACLFEVTDKGEVPVTIPTIRSWKADVMKRLFDRIKEISHLNDDETEEVLLKRIEEAQAKLDALRGKEDRLKNLLNGSTATSGSLAS